MRRKEGRGEGDPRETTEYKQVIEDEVRGRGEDYWRSPRINETPALAMPPAAE